MECIGNMKSRTFLSVEELTDLFELGSKDFSYIFKKYVFREGVDKFSKEGSHFWFTAYIARLLLLEKLISEEKFLAFKGMPQSSSIELSDNTGEMAFRIDHISPQLIEVGYVASGISISNRLIIDEDKLYKIVDDVLNNLENKVDDSEVINYSEGGFKLGIQHKGYRVSLVLEFERMKPRKTQISADMLIDLYRVADFFRDLKRKYKKS